MRVFIAEESTVATAAELAEEEDTILTAEQLIRGEETLPEETDHLIFVIYSEKGSVSPVMQYYLEHLLTKRDNTGITYCAAVCDYTRRPFLTLYIMESLLYNAGLALPYSVIIKDKAKIKDDLAHEEILVHGRILCSRFISRFLLRRGRRNYRGV